ncbi:MAG TPA: adenylate/guanylate cyclase domain-containing protein [Polyangiaceae bacterium]|jgi:class 3 adenylate cyclase|nr:adenylate/guanylate cyclase domain-containing protein [Polyangiaceae bacterium]
MESAEQCSECQTAISPGARFCVACGHEVVPTSRTSERRHLTVLFCDLVGSTELSQRLDPEDLRDLLRSYQRVCREAVGRYEGHIFQFWGDGALIYFGYPVAHEDDPVRAVNAALRILESVSLVNEGIGKRLSAELHLRAGIHTGIVVVGEIVPGGKDVAIGETVNRAARIQSSADVDTVALSATTARLVHGHFELERREPQMLKGFARPEELFQVVRPTGARTKFEAAARRGLTPYVGREEESTALHGLWGEVRAGADRVVVVRGEAGIGKSRIVHQFRTATLEHPARILECICSPLAQATALSPIATMLEGFVTEFAKMHPNLHTRTDVLARMIGEHSRFGPDALPLMAALLSYRGADEASIVEMSPQRRRARTLEILRDWLGWTAERIPTALLVEDVHWADPSTLDLLDLLVTEPPGGRTLVCMTARPEFVVRWSPGAVRTIELHRMNVDEVAAVTTHVAAGHRLPFQLVQKIAERSEGVPLFVEEMTKALLEGLHTETNGYDTHRLNDAHLLPPTVQASLVARFERLGESRAVAQLGATIGRSFTYRLMRAVAELPDEKLREQLDQLCRTELAFGDGELPHTVYTFKHALIQDALYETLLRTDRQRLHERVFAKLNENFPDIVEAQPEVAAYHAENAGLRDLAVPLLQQAGMRALGRTAMAEAVRHLGHALHVVQSFDEPARSKAETELQAVLGPAYMATLGWAAPEVERSTARLRDLATAQGDGKLLFQAMWGLWTVHFLRGELDHALEIAHEVLGMANEMDDAVLRFGGYHSVGYTHYYRGEFDEALRRADQGLEHFDFEREKVTAVVFQLSLSAAMLCFRAQAQQITGLGDQASATLRRWCALLADLKHTPSSAYSLCQQCFLAWLADDLDQVEVLAAESRSLSVAEGFNLWVPLADIFIAWAEARRGRNPADAVEKIEAALRTVHAGRTYVVESEVASIHAEVLLLAGRPERVRGVAEAALAIVKAGKQRNCEPELHRLQGAAEEATGDAVKAAAFYRSGIETARAMGALLLELRSALALAKLTRGHTELAELRAVFGRFTEGFEQSDCKKAVAFLQTVDAQ